MITDDQLYTLAIFLGSAAMLMIVLYHFLEVNARDSNDELQDEKVGVGAVKAQQLQEGTSTTTAKLS